MEVVVRVSEHLDEDRVREFLSVLKIPNVSIDPVITPANKPSRQRNEQDKFYLEVEPGGEDLTVGTAQKHLDNQATVFLFNADLQPQDQPKVIYMTDHSAASRDRLEKFKQLRPAGFLGATVISESETSPTKYTWNEVSKQILHRIRTSVQTTRANLIIANYDLSTPGRKAQRAECLTKMVKQNKCHVLVLKT